MSGFPKGCSEAFFNLLNRGTLSLSEFDSLLADDSLNALSAVTGINTFLQELHYSTRIVNTICPYTEKQFVTITYPSNKVYKTNFSPAQVLYFREILTHFLKMDNEDKLADWGDVLSLVDEVEGFKITLTQAESFLQQFITHHFLRECHIGNGTQLGLGVRALSQFEKEIDESSPRCLICHESLFTGVKCNECSAILHKSCFFDLFQARNGRVMNCPQCRQTFKPLEELETLAASLAR
ncbi:hypothetical protein P9112_009151 [Eukaryota sp. TZLM1-RC]